MGRATENNSLSTKAYTILRHRILRGELPLGEVISRRKIAAELGMSLLPVMEALVRLELEGLLESRPRAGTRIRIPTREDVIGHSVVREALEGQAARLAALHATAAERESLLKLAVRVDVAQHSDQVQFATLHQRFHMRVVECTHVAALLKAIESTHALHSIWLCARVPRLPEHSRNNREHQDLANVLTGGTPEEAEHEMRQHVARGFQQIMDGLEPYFKMRKLRGEIYSRTVPKNSPALTTA
jgi:GntR family transcriptional regulator, rspAB operon transcriptional repressor